jgi:hypothetical protein
VSLATALERAAEALPSEADVIRPANGDPVRLLAGLSAEGAVRVLVSLLGHDVDAAEELLGAWLEEPPGVAALLAVEEAGLPKPARKLVRRAQHFLKSQGVKIEAPAPSPTVAKLPKVEDELRVAAVSAPDPFGFCMAYLVEGHPSGGVRLFEVSFGEGQGIAAVEVYAAGRSKVRAFLRELTGRRGLAAVEAPITAVRALLRRAAAAQPADKPLPAGWLEWHSRLDEVDESTPTPGEFVRDGLGEPGEPLDLEPVLAMVRDGRVGPWPDREALTRTARRIQEMTESKLIVAGARRREQIDALIAEGAQEAWGGPGKARIAALFRHTAFVLLARGDEAGARACLAAAAAFERRPPAENPLARALFERPLTGFLEQLEQKEREDAEQGSLIVKPGDTRPGAGPDGIR